MKKTLAVILSIIIALTLSVQSFAAVIDREEFYPIIIVPGYSASGLYMQNEDGTKTHVWGIDTELILKRVLARSIDLARGVKELTKGNAQLIADTVGPEFAQMFEHMRCNPDGTSVYDIHTYTSTAADSNNTYLLENEDGKYMYEQEIMAMFGSYIGEDWNDYIFNFSTDFRMNVEKCAANLDRYIDSVLEYTGAEKVNIYCVSHGGQVGATFLNLYGEQKADKINNVLLTIPAIGGSTIAYAFYTGDIKFDEENLLYFIENGMMFENDYHWLMSNENLNFIDEVLGCLLPYIKNVMGYWGSMLDFVPANDYESIRSTCFNSEESAPLLEKSDRFHREIYPSMAQRLQACVDAGINVYIIAGTGNKDIVGRGEAGDAIISASSSTGAACAPYGKRFANGYETLKTVCGDSTHNHLSPSMEVDASTCYLPEYTWFVDGFYHGMTVKSDYNTELITRLMFTDDRIDIYTYEEFPQFHADTNRCQAVFAHFNNSVEGYVSQTDNTLVVENCSKKYPLRLVSVSCGGMELDFDNSFLKEIPVGGKIEIPFKGEIPCASGVKTEVTVNYVQVGAVTPIGSRTFDFTVMNGEKVSFDSENPIVSSNSPQDSLLDFILKFISQPGMQKLITMLYNTLKALILNII
ncbi:MAG: hypothetical protein UHL70_07530 [Acutalibacteraceae bacterium]|nr:hypothetical protein [Acutalibacteraceae bacterium]